MDSHNTDPQFMRTVLFGTVKSPWFYTDMPTDNRDSVRMDFWITQMPFWPIDYQSTLVNTDKVAQTGDMASGRHVYCYWLMHMEMSVH